MIQKDIEVLKAYLQHKTTTGNLRESIEQALVYIQYLEFKIEEIERKKING